MALHRATVYAKGKKAEIFDLLGRECKLCHEKNEELLEFDHINGRDYNPNELSNSARMARYLREAQRGELRVLCKSCNLAVRKRYENGGWCRTEHNPAKTLELPEIVEEEI